MWVTLADLKLDMGITDNRDDQILQNHLDAAVDFVQRIHPDPGVLIGEPADWGDEGLEVPADIKLGTLRLAARWYSRRKSPSALVDFGDLGSARIPSFDPDIDRLLRIGRYRDALFA